MPKPRREQKEEKKWKEHTSLKSFTEKKSTALWKECPQETVARFLQEDAQRAEQDSLTEFFRQIPNKDHIRGLPFCGLFFKDLTLNEIYC